MQGKRTSAKEATTYLYQDEESFKRPIESAIETCKQAFVAASAKVSGAEVRTRAATEDLESLKAFGDAVEARMRAKSFHDLPGLKRGRERLEGFHQLTVGPWRGVFLVNADGTAVIALVFSKFPHSLESRLDEVVEPYRTKDREEDEAGGDSSSGPR